MGVTHLEPILLGAAFLLILSIIASKASEKLGVPSLILFLGLGMLAGSEGPGGIHFDNAQVAQGIGVTALALILFAGGLEMQWIRLRPVFWSGLSLSTIGVLVTALLVSWFTHHVLGFTRLEGFLLGAVVSSTDAAAVFSVLRSRSLALKEPLIPLLELESGSNDPMAVFLTLGAIDLILQPSVTGWQMLPFFVRQMGLALILGWLFGRLIPWSINRLNLEHEGLYPGVTIALAMAAYSITAYLGGNGFLAVYLAGLLTGRSEFIHKRTLTRFHNGLAWLMQIAMFLALGLLVYPSQLLRVAFPALMVSLFLILVARPLSVFASLSLARLGLRRKLLVSWVGLRGAAPIILATFPLVAGIPRASMFFNIVFFIVLTSVLIQGPLLPWVARRLRLLLPRPPRRYFPLELDRAQGVDMLLEEYIVPFNAAAVGRPLYELGLPPDCLVTLVCRDERYLVPSGMTVLQEGDVLLTLVTEGNRGDVQSMISRQRSEAAS